AALEIEKHIGWEGACRHYIHPVPDDWLAAHGDVISIAPEPVHLIDELRQGGRLECLAVIYYRHFRGRLGTKTEHRQVAAPAVIEHRVAIIPCRTGFKNREARLRYFRGAPGLRSRDQ